jgi:hypothetical protein
MVCPLYIDYTRECISEIKVYPKNINQGILNFCSSKKYLDCPFYKILVVKKNICENILNCSLYKKFQIGDFEKFVEFSNEYCTSKNYLKCKRYIMNKKGLTSPTNLHPNGKIIESWDKKI